MNAIKTITILGSTGSIGQSTLNVIAEHRAHFRVFALTASQNASLLFQQCQIFQPRYAVLKNKTQVESLKQQFKTNNLPTEVLTEEEALSWVASHPSVDMVMSAISGSAGLVPTLAAAAAGKKILLANKESLVMAGTLLMKTVQKNNATLLPVDSEHNAIFQCLPDHYVCGVTPEAVKKIVLTASGGPFRISPIETFQTITIEQALAHPNWKMGKKISIDSATMMNKALEVIEAHYLFNLPSDKIEVIIHPESIIHSCVQYQDGSTLAQMGYSDMRIPITYALFHPDRMTSSNQDLDFQQLNKLHFEKVDEQRFPLLKLAFEAIKKGGTAPAILNAANEVAVDAFLSKKIKFTDIAFCVQQTFVKVKSTSADNLDAILNAHHDAQNFAKNIIQLLLSH
jgi:1-deoxy-D-xylulose-5-phosphate reductoisomerase